MASPATPPPRQTTSNSCGTTLPSVTGHPHPPTEDASPAVQSPSDLGIDRYQCVDRTDDLRRLVACPTRQTAFGFLRIRVASRERGCGVRRRYRRYLRLIDRTLRIWFHGSSILGVLVMRTILPFLVACIVAVSCLAGAASRLP